MDKSNLELFKQAISEGLSNKFDSVINGYTEEIVCSENHDIAMRTIVYGKVGNKDKRMSKKKLIVTILVAAALLLTSCGIIFRNEIRGLVEEVYNLFTAVSYTDEEPEGNRINEIYEFTYVPNGYSLKDSRSTDIRIRYEFTNGTDSLWFEQNILDGTDFVMDNESGYTKIENIRDYEVYYRFTDRNHLYVFNNGEYGVRIRSTTELSDEEINSIIDGIKTK